MPRGYANYDFVVDSSFRPYTFAEMVQPFAIYKDAYEKAEAQYEDIANQDIMRYLSNLPEGSRSRDIYDNYMKEFNKQSEDFSKHGLNMSNRKALTNLRKRYKSEIGRLEAANTAMQEERKLRRTMNAKDSSMLYANDNLSLDDFLDGATPNLYNISGTELYTKGAAMGKAASSRMYKAGDAGSVLGGYFRNWKEVKGVSQESIAEFMNSEVVQQEVDNMLKADGVTGNLTGANLERARQQVLNGIYAGIVYEESNKPVEDKSKISAAQRAQLADNRDARALNAALYGFKKDAKGNWVKDDEGTNVKSGKGSSGSSGSAKRGSSTDKVTQSNSRTKVVWQGGDPALSSVDAKNYKPETVANDESSHPGILYEYDDLPAYAQDVVDNIVKDGRYELYDIYFSPLKKGVIYNDMPELEVVPRKVVTDEAQEASALQSLFGAGGN